MFKQFQEMIEESTPGRFEGETPMTAYVHELLMDGNFGDDELHYNDGSSVYRYGRRILTCQSSGFIGLESMQSARVAENVFKLARVEEVNSICREFANPAELWEQLESGKAHWLDEANVDEWAIREAILGQFGAILMPPLTNGAFSHVETPGVAFRIVSPSFLHYVRVVMVGDDHVTVTDLNSLRPLGEDNYCGTCGQIGCGWH